MIESGSAFCENRLYDIKPVVWIGYIIKPYTNLK